MSANSRRNSLQRRRRRRRQQECAVTKEKQGRQRKVTCNFSVVRTDMLRQTRRRDYAARPMTSAVQSARCAKTVERVRKSGRADREERREVF